MMRKWLLSIVIVTCFLLTSWTSVSANTLQKELKVGENAYIDVSVATLWTEPGITRPVDEPSITNPVDMWKWTTSMTYDERLWLVGNLETQGLLGTEVTILEKQGDWVKVAVHGQPTPREEAGYPGWMPANQLTKNEQFEKFLEKRPFAHISSPTALLYDDPNFEQAFMEISISTRLPVIAETKNAVKVATPSDGQKWLKKEDVQVYHSVKDIPKPTADDLLDTAYKFLGLPYLWAGTSGFGFDCSGFTHTIYKVHGITIPRDSSVQAVQGTPVAEEDLQPGDLIFFAYDEGKGRVHHVGMYIGGGKMIHSPNTASTVRIDNYRAPGYGEEYAGARRYLE